MKINVIAHRGNNKYKCDNKINCLLKSLNTDYIDGIEIDVRMTKDNKFVLSHNSIILHNNKVINISNTKYKNLTISKLDDLLSNIDNKKIIIIDMKEAFKYKKYVHYIIKLIKKYNYLNISLCSFNYDLIYYFKKKYPNYRCGLIIGYLINEKKDYHFFDFISINSSLINKYTYPHYIWTINNIKNLKLDNNCLGIITDNSYLFNSE